MTQRQIKRIIRSIIAKLTAAYGHPEVPHTDPFDEFITAILASESSEKLARRAKGRLMRDFVDWNEARVATTEQLENSLTQSRVSNPIKKAELLKCFLEKVFNDRNVMNLDHLKEAGPRKIRKYLSSFDGMPRSITDRVLLKSLGFPVLPISSNITRTMKRIGVLPQDADDSKAKTILEKTVPKRTQVAFYLLVEQHAENICQFNSYKCRRCTLRKICSFAKRTR